MMTNQPDDDDTLHRVIAMLQADVPVPPGLVDRIAHRRRQQRQRQRRVTIGVVLTALAGIVLVRQGFPPEPVEPTRSVVVVAPPPPSGDLMTFTLDAPTSRDVALVGDFTNWRTDSIHLAAQDDGTWAVTVHLPPGRYRYAYVIDDEEWLADPGALLIPDDFGRPTSVVVIGSAGPLQ